MSILKKLSNVQQKLSVPKNQYNKFGKYNYRSCEDIVESAKPLLAEEGLVMTITDEIVVIGDRHYVKATVTVHDPAEDAEHSVQGFAREEENKKGMDSMQLTGATSSYARKYALNGMFAIDDAKDSDDLNKHGQDREKSSNSKGKYLQYIRSAYQKYTSRVEPLMVDALDEAGKDPNNLKNITKLSAKQLSSLHNEIKKVLE